MCVLLHAAAGSVEAGWRMSAAGAAGVVSLDATGWLLSPARLDLRVVGPNKVR